MKCYFSKVRITVKRIARSHKHAVALIIIFGVTVVLHLVRSPFILNENQMLYFLSTIAQVTGALFGLTLAAYSLIDDKIRKIGEEDESSVDYSTTVRTDSFEQLKRISILSSASILLSLFVLTLYRKMVLDFTIFFLLIVVCVFLSLLVEVYRYVGSVNPNKIEKLKAEEKQKFDTEYSQKQSNSETSFGSFITCYNLLERVVKDLARKVFDENSQNQIEIKWRIMDCLDILKDAKIISSRCRGQINELRMYRNTLVHSTENDKNVNSTLFGILRYVCQVLQGINEKYTDKGYRESAITKLEHYVDALPINVDVEVWLCLKQNSYISLYDLSKKLNVSLATVKRRVENLISYQFVMRSNEGWQVFEQLPEFSFNYSNFDGIYQIGDDSWKFSTKWSKGDNECIHAYSDCDDIEWIACMKMDPDSLQILCITQEQCLHVDHSSRARMAYINDVIVWKNKEGHYLLTQVLDIKDGKRTNEDDMVRCKFRTIC